MIRAIVVEDERLTMQRICSLLGETGRVEVIGGYTDPLEAMEQIFEQQPDAVFLDIEMPELNGLELAEKIYESQLESEIVFVTAYNEYALEAFKVNALDYLLKPVLVKELDRALDRVERRRPQKKLTGTKKTNIKVSVLGGFNLWTEENKEPIKWYTAKCKELIAYFVLLGPSVEVSKWKLMELLWPDKDSEKGDINLRSTLCRLNKTLGESGSGMRIVSNRNSYFLKAGGITVDALELQKLACSDKAIEKNSQSVYEDAIASYKGSLLEGYEYCWVEELRADCQRYFVILCRRLAEYHMKQLKNGAAALNTVEALLREEPYDEEAHYMALKLLHMTRGRAAADLYFQELCSKFEEELGVEPGSALRALYDEIMRIE